MSLNLLDNPLILSVVFYPRQAPSGIYPETDPLQAGIQDGVIPVTDDIVVGYRFYAHIQPDAPLILLFHGNGEIAPDYDGIAPDYHRAGASLMVVDYRGYGWSSGRPLVSAMLRDAEKVLMAVPDVLAGMNRPVTPVYIKGRSLGSASAIHLAYTHPERFRGLIIESGFADLPSVLMRMGLTLARLAGLDDAPVANARKMAAVHLPLLVIHGEEDTILPVENGQKLYDASPAGHKTLLRVPGAGHNDLLWYARSQYFGAVAQFLRETV